jgi:hypothetical protein
MWQRFDENEGQADTLATLDGNDAVHPGSLLDRELFALVEDAELCAEMQDDPELHELAEMTRFSSRVCAILAPARRNIEPSVSERVGRICGAVLRRAGALPPEAALLDDADQDRVLERKLVEYRMRKRGLAKLLPARTWGRRDGTESEKG